MKDFAGVVEMQAENLLATLERQQATRCQEISHTARERARQLLKAARRQSRERMRQAVAQERQRIDSALLQAQGRMRTRERRHLQQHCQDLLKDAWPLLEARMRARWKDSDQRRAWCEMLLADAMAIFGTAPLSIEHPPGLREDDRAWMTQVLRKAGCGDVTFKVDESIAAGLRIRTPQACLDGTLEGLLGDHREVEAILLAAWERAAAQSADDVPAARNMDCGHG